jgi:glycosyltransferase involved in cell wall biosynthesis
LENLIRVKLFFRKRAPQFNSIEELFGAISAKLSNTIHIEDVFLPYERVTPKKILWNIKYARKKSGRLNHITGHINYVSLGLKCKTVLTIHDIGSSLKGNRINKFLIKLIWYWIPSILVNKITVISEFSKKELTKVIPFAKHKIRVIYNPVKEEFIYVPKDFNIGHPNILFIGTKSNKNLVNTIKALKGVSCELHIIGKLTEKQSLLLSQSGIKYKNQFFIPYEDIIKAYKNCDIMCFPSTYEGFGMPIIEAQAIGRPVLTSNFGAMKEVAGEGACLVDPYSVSSIRDGLEKIINNDKFRQSLIDKGLKNVERFKIDKIVNDYLSIYEELNKE